MNNFEIETRYYTPALMELGMWLTEEEYRKMNAVIVCGPPDSPDPDSIHAQLQHSHTVMELRPMTYSENTCEHKDIGIRGETAAVIPEEDLYSRFFAGNVDITGLSAAPNTESTESEFIDVCGLTTNLTEYELPDYETMMADEPKVPNTEEVESDYIDVCALSTSLTNSELPGYETTSVADEPLETSHHYNENSCSFNESTDNSDDDSEGSDVSTFSPDQQYTSTPGTPQQPIYMLASYAATPTTSHKRIRRRHLNFRDPNLIYDLSDISDEGDEPAAKRPAIDDGITHNGMIAQWVNDIVQLYRLRSTTCASVQC